MSAAALSHPATLGDPASGGGPSTYQWVFAWVLLIALLALADKTETGHTVIYYALVLILVLLLVTQYQFIAAALKPIGQPAPSLD
jgi:hypothetical protein